MTHRNCFFCGKEPLSKKEVGLTKKLIDKDSTRFFCLGCLAEHLEVDPEFLLVKAEGLKDQGCKEF